MHAGKASASASRGIDKNKLHDEPLAIRERDEEDGEEEERASVLL